MSEALKRKLQGAFSVNPKAAKNEKQTNHLDQLHQILDEPQNSSIGNIS